MTKDKARQIGVRQQKRRGQGKHAGNAEYPRPIDRTEEERNESDEHGQRSENDCEPAQASPVLDDALAANLTRLRPYCGAEGDQYDGDEKGNYKGGHGCERRLTPELSRAAKRTRLE